MRGGRPPARSVFIDTHGLAAAINADDPHHGIARTLLDSFADSRTAVYTSDWVLAELLSICSRRGLRKIAALTVLDLRASPLTTVVEASRRTWDQGFALFQARPDKDWSLVDCTTIILCARHRIGRVLTHDHHFVQAGLEIMIA